jgi:transcriptional regulator NrdR family protein
MKCHECNGKTKVIDSRTVLDELVYRRRKCLNCGTTFTTYEERDVRPSKK